MIFDEKQQSRLELGEYNLCRTNRTKKEEGVGKEG